MWASAQRAEAARVEMHSWSWAMAMTLRATRRRKKSTAARRETGGETVVELFHSLGMSTLSRLSRLSTLLREDSKLLCVVKLEPGFLSSEAGAKEQQGSGHAAGGGAARG
ncbi:hypothetical protein E4U41_004801 [Claviceps citrina]|nr:hypothetical protein E4U41_004801 [Claviceps citrina]